MQTRPIELTDVIYNAANQRFEALVTVHDAGNTRKYPCAIGAPISMSFEDAAKGLSIQAKRRHLNRTGSYSQVKRHIPAVRAGRGARFDTLRWLESIVTLPGRNAA